MRAPEPARRETPAPPPFQAALRLEYFAVGYNLLEAAASVAFGTVTRLRSDASWISL